MQKRAIDVVKLLFPLGREKRKALQDLRALVTEREYGDVQYLARLRKIGFHYDRFGTSAALVPDASWPQLAAAAPDEDVVTVVERLNKKIADQAMLATFESFKLQSVEAIAKLVAPNLLGMDAVKEAATVQLFTQEPLHILLLGDPGTGKTEVLRSIERLAPHAIFGLGSGASKAGLTGIYDGKEFQPGLLVLADEGFALIDELNLLKKEDQAGLYSAMEKGFLTYDKKGAHEKFDARVRVLATANPKGDRFVGKDAKLLRTQLPFDPALLSRFHLLFLIRRASARELESITRKIVKDEVRDLEDGDARFVKAYVSYAERLNVAFDPKFEPVIVSFIDDLRAREESCLVEIGPRLVIGVIRLAKAYARSRLSRTTSADDVERAMKLMNAALVVKKA